jgi:galactose-6-phosphate isomerase
MPDLDFTEALAEPSFQDSFTVLRRQEVVGDNGVETTVITSINTHGVVVPAGDDEVVRTPDDETANQSLNITTQFPLRQAVVGYQPDIIFWHDQHFIVMRLDDFTGYGSGWVSAMCLLYDFNAEPQQMGLIGSIDFSDPNDAVFAGLIQCS